MQIFATVFMASPLNSSKFDVALQLTGVVLCILLLGLLEFSRAAYKLHILRFFLAFSLSVTIILSYMLNFAPQSEYAHVYWITQSLSYIIEVALCIELAKLVIVNNWYVVAIFTPFIFAVSALMFILYGIPKRLSDITHQAYVHTLICGFILLMVWLLQNKLEGKLQQPYSGIAFVFACYMAVRFGINYLHSYYGTNHREIISRLTPLNEILLLIGWLIIILHYFPNTNLNACGQKIQG